MTAYLLDLFALPPVQRGFLALVIAGLGLPLVGVGIVGLGIYPLRFTIMHVALLGAALGQAFTFPPLLSALALCALTGFFLSGFSSRPGGAPGAMGFLMVVSIALAFLVLSFHGVHAGAAFALLWGSVLASTALDVCLLGMVCLALLCFFWWQRQGLALLVHDRELAFCAGVPVSWLTTFLYVGMAMAIAAAIRLTGALLVDAVTILPALTAQNLGKSLGQIVLWAMFAGLFGNVLGFFLAVFFDQPLGPVLVLVAGAMTLLTYAWTVVRGRTV